MGRDDCRCRGTARVKANYPDLKAHHAICRPGIQACIIKSNGRPIAQCHRRSWVNPVVLSLRGAMDRLMSAHRLAVLRNGEKTESIGTRSCSLEFREVLVDYVESSCRGTGWITECRVRVIGPRSLCRFYPGLPGIGRHEYARRPEIMVRLSINHFR